MPREAMRRRCSYNVESNSAGVGTLCVHACCSRYADTCPRLVRCSALQTSIRAVRGTQTRVPTQMAIDVGVRTEAARSASTQA